MEKDENSTLNFNEMVGKAQPADNGLPHAGEVSGASLGPNEATRIAEAELNASSAPIEPVHAAQVQQEANPMPSESQDQLSEAAIEQIEHDQSAPVINPTPALATVGVGATEANSYSWLSFESARLHVKGFFKSQVFRYFLIGVASVGIFVLVFNFPVIYANLAYRFHKTPPVAANKIETPVAVTPQAQAVAGGDVVIIPKLNVNVPIVYVPSLDEKQIQFGLRSGVVHYAGTANPGDVGNAVIFGHSSNDWWQPGSYKFIFALLDKLAPGDTIEIHYKQKKYVYRVSGTKIVVPTDFSVIGPTAQPTLTLITCTPAGTSLKRLIVSAPQIDPAITAQTTQAPATPTQTTDQVLPGQSNGVWAKLTSWFTGLFN